MLLAAFGSRRPTADADALALGLSNDEATVVDRVGQIARQPMPDDGVEFHTETVTSRIIRRSGARGGAAITAETAFRLAALGDREIDDATIQRATEESAAFLNQAPPTPGWMNMEEVEELRQSLLTFFKPVHEYEFFPTIPGSVPAAPKRLLSALPIPQDGISASSLGPGRPAVTDQSKF
jgi:hypothetical protein